LNDRAYFCDEHWKSFHKLYDDARQSENEDLWLQKHKKVAVEMRPNDFDFCEDTRSAPTSTSTPSPPRPTAPSA
jgi:hypothetical protein